MGASDTEHDPGHATQAVDLGLTQVLYGQEQQHTKGVGTPLWMAPEILAGRAYGLSADVYSYGVVLWEIAAQRDPWMHVQSGFISNELLKRITAGERPAIDEGWPADYVELMGQCWRTEPADRPTFSHLLRTMAGRDGE